MGAADEGDYDAEHGVPRPGRGASYRPPAAGGDEGPEAGGGSFTFALPSQLDELREISVLSKDAAELLWEMLLLGEVGEEVADMRSKAAQLQSQLRGLIGDYAGGDEAVLASGIEAFDMITRCLEEQKGGGEGAAAAAAPAEAAAEAAAETEEAQAAGEPEAAAKPAAAPLVPPPGAVAAPVAPLPAAAAATGDDLISFD